MRTLDENFIAKFQTGGLFHPIIDAVIQDTTLDFEIRDGYINLYFKGNSILKLNENGILEIHDKFLKGTGFLKQAFSTAIDVNSFLLKNSDTIKSWFRNVRLG